MNGMIELEAGKLKATPKYSSTEFLNLKTYFTCLLYTSDAADE